MNEPKVFISYSHDDAEWVGKFGEALRGQGVDVWLDSERVQPGESLRDALETALRESDAIITVLSPASAGRPNLFFELGVALGTGKRLIPVVPPELDSSVIPFGLRTRRSLKMGAPDEAAREVSQLLRHKAA